MRYSEQFMEHIEYAFHAFCKVALSLLVGSQEGKISRLLLPSIQYGTFVTR